MDVTDERLANVTAVLVEPPNTATGIVDKMSYLLQEEEFPSDVYTHNDIAMLRRQQTHILHHAFKRRLFVRAC
jgi:16S rRNA C967 or C1407 C5-methylase (RsmB/RsmF family)